MSKTLVARKPKQVAVIGNVKPKISGVVYKVHFNDDEYSDNEDASVTMIKNGTDTFTFELCIQGGPFCCGVSEFGGFSAYGGTTITTKEKVKGIKMLLTEILDSYQYDDKSLAVYLTLVPNCPSCKILEEAIKDEELFTLVKTFKNKNSGLTNKLYINNS